jgi:hypothetical protein
MAPQPWPRSGAFMQKKPTQPVLLAKTKGTTQPSGLFGWSLAQTTSQPLGEEDM